MKEITRKLYRKPVLLTMAFLVGMALVVGLFITTKGDAQATVVPAGDDMFETTGNGETFHNFGNDPIPAGFFTSNNGSPSLAYNQLVPLVGKALTSGSDIDTIIHRNQTVTVPGTTSLTMTGLSLDSINAIKITYANGSSEDWDMHVGLSAFKSSTGSMTIENGGTFDSSLKVWPKFTFKSRLDGETKELDTGSSGLVAALSAVSERGDVEFEPFPEPQPTATVAPCPIIVSDTDVSRTSVFATSAAASSCAPVTLTSNNSNWGLCNGRFCIPRPLTEAELWASHNASPPGTKKKFATKTVGADQ
jgi:hypothetical protein